MRPSGWKIVHFWNKTRGTHETLVRKAERKLPRQSSECGTSMLPIMASPKYTFRSIRLVSSMSLLPNPAQWFATHLHGLLLLVAGSLNSIPFVDIELVRVVATSISK